MREFPVSRFVLVAFVMLIYGCQQPHNSNEATKNESTETFEDFENPVVDSAIANACSSKVMITELPIGFKFGNTKKDINISAAKLRIYSGLGIFIKYHKLFTFSLYAVSYVIVV